MKKKAFYLIAFYLLSFYSISFSQEIYVDINPDKYLFPNEGDYYLDLNADGVDDFILQSTQVIGDELYIKVIGLGLNEILIEPSTEYALALNALDQINENMTWDTTTLMVKNSSLGNWWAVQGKYLGVRILIDGEYIYGWIRIDGPVLPYPGDNSITLRDYGYNPVPNEVVAAGFSGFYNVNSLLVSDVDDNRNGTDLFVSYPKALGENEIVEYRLMVVKAENAASFSMEDALLLGTDKYLVIEPTNQDLYEQTFNVNSTDIDGDLISNLAPYKVFVLCYTTLPDYEAFLSNNSKEIMLKTPADAVSGIAGEDVDNYGDGRDLKIMFEMIPDETTISEYRIFVVDYSQADSFAVEQAIELSEEYYVSVIPNGQNIEITLNENDQTIEGLPITSGGYCLFVTTVPDSVQTDYSGFSEGEMITGLVQPYDIMILAGQIREQAIFVDSTISVGASISPNSFDSQDVDLNNDGVNDLHLSASGWATMAGGGASAGLSANTNTEVVGLPLEYNTPIDEGLNWGNTSGYVYYDDLMGYVSSGGAWLDAGVKYLGVFIKKENNMNVFCWAKMHASATSYGASLQIHNWAYIDLECLFVREDLMDEMKVFPNPAKDFVQIKLNTTEYSDLDIKILDNTGRVVLVESLKVRNGVLSERIDISDLDTGIYFLRINSEKREFAAQKIVVW